MMGKKNKHHKFLIEKFSKKEAFDDIINAVNRDLEDLKECKTRIDNLKKELGFSNRSEYHKKVLDLYTEMKQWKRLFLKFLNGLMKIIQKKVLVHLFKH